MIIDNREGDSAGGVGGSSNSDGREEDFQAHWQNQDIINDNTTNDDIERLRTTIFYLEVKLSIFFLFFFILTNWIYYSMNNGVSLFIPKIRHGIFREHAFLICKQMSILYILVGFALILFCSCWKGGQNN